MPRVSSAPEDAYKGAGRGFIEGFGEIINAKAVVFQYPPQKEAKNDRPAGYQDPPALFAELSIQRLTPDQKPDGSEPETVLLKIAGPNATTGELDTVHPGNYPDGDINQDPEDCGGDLGAEGNTVYAVKDGFQFNDKVKWITFVQSLVEHGFKPSILKATYFPSLIGLVAEFETVQKAKKPGEKYDSSIFGVKSIKVYPYEKKAQSGVAATTGKTAAKAAAASKPAAATSAAAQEPLADSAGADLNAEELAEQIIVDTLAPARSGKTLDSLKRVIVETKLAMGKHKPAIPPAMRKPLHDVLTEEFVQMIGEANGLFVVETDGKVVFA